MKGMPSATGKGRLIYIFQRYRLSSAACLPVRLTGMQNILGSTFDLLTVTSHSLALEFPLIIILHLQEVLVSIILKHTVRFIIGSINSGGRGPPHMQLYFYDTDESIAHRVKSSPKLDTSMIRLILRILQDNLYVLLFKNLDSMPNIAEYNIELNMSISLDQT